MMHSSSTISIEGKKIHKDDDTVVPADSYHGGGGSNFFSRDEAGSIFSEYLDDSTLSSSEGADSFSSFQHTLTSSGFKRQAREESLYLSGSRDLRRSAQKEKLLPKKLQFLTLGIHGRNKETEILMRCLEKINAENNSEARELILIDGNSGTGKTALSSTLIETTKKLNGLYVRGKFDSYHRDEPYAGIAAACREICGSILLLQQSPVKGRSFSEIRGELSEKLGSNVGVLSNIIPELTEIVGDDLVAAKDQVYRQDGEEAKARFNNVFRVFIRVVARYFAPFVFVLDDLQWADAASLELMGVLIADHDNPRFMMLGLYRSNEIDESLLLNAMDSNMESKADQGNFNITKITIGNIGVSQINEILMHLLSSEDEEVTLGLSKICLKRTLGNPFFLLVFIKMLKDEELLDFSFHKYKWIWNEENILSRTRATTNVVDMMKNNIVKLPHYVVHQMTIAACLGSSFVPSEFDVVWPHIRQQFSTTNDGVDDTSQWLSIAEEEGFIEKNGASSYRWIHDKVQEAALSVVPSDELSRLKAQIGEILVQELNDADLNSSIFVVVNLLNQGPTPKEETKRIKLSELNLLAAKSAVNSSAYHSAKKYSVKGIETLPANRWIDHYTLTLTLYSTAVEARGYLGMIELMEELYNEVVEQKERPLCDKLRVYNVMIRHLGGTMRYQEAVTLMLEILEQLGYKFPKSKSSRLFKVLLGVFKLKARIKSVTPEAIAQLPTINDAVQVEIMKLLAQLATYSYRSDSKELLPLAIFESVNFTFKNGLCEYSPPAFAFFGLIQTGMLGDFELGSKCGQFAKLILNKLQCKTTEARTGMLIYSFISCWTKPAHTLILPLLNGYQAGLSFGDTENAAISIHQSIVLGFQSSKHLKMLETDCRVYTKQMHELGRENMLNLTMFYWFAILALIGEGEIDWNLFQGEPFTDLNEILSREESDLPTMAVIKSLQSRLYAIFGEHEKGAELAFTYNYAKTNPGHPAIMPDAFARGISLYAMARKTKKRKYLKHAKKVHLTVKSWVRKGNPNVTHYDRLLNAELAALKGDLDAAEGWFQSAVVLASRTGFTNDAALANERYGEFLLSERKDKHEAIYKFEEAMKLYVDWGALGKAESLHKKHSSFWPLPEDISVRVL